MHIYNHDNRDLCLVYEGHIFMLGEGCWLLVTLPLDNPRVLGQTILRGKVRSEMDGRVPLWTIPHSVIQGVAWAQRIDRGLVSLNTKVDERHRMGHPVTWASIQYLLSPSIAVT